MALSQAYLDMLENRLWGGHVIPLTTPQLFPIWTLYVEFVAFFSSISLHIYIHYFNRVCVCVLVCLCNVSISPVMLQFKVTLLWQ